MDDCHKKAQNAQKLRLAPAVFSTPRATLPLSFFVPFVPFCGDSTNLPWNALRPF
jgi:hypothetical protein